MRKRSVDLLVLGSGETVTLEPGVGEDGLGIIDNGGLAVRNGLIVEAGSSQLLESKYRSKLKVDVEGGTILPGFVDPHTHIVFKGSREEEFQKRISGVPYMEILQRGGGILDTVRKTREASPQSLLTEANERLDNALESGTTTVEVKSGYGLSLADELKILTVINKMGKQHPCRVIPTFLGAHALPPEHSSTGEFARVVADRMLPQVAGSGLARFCDVFCETGAFSPENTLMILKRARALGLGAKVHADEFDNSGGAKVANQLRAVSADHLIHSPNAELEKMAGTGVTPVVLPASSHSLMMKKRAPVHEMLRVGLPVALGTDFNPANWVLGQLTVAAVAARDLAMKVEDIIRGITINAARSMGLKDRIGSLKPGKEADVVVLQAPNYKWVGYTYGERIVDKVLIHGRVVVDNGRRVR